MILEMLVIISIIASISAPVVIYYMQYHFLKQMQHKLEQATNDAKTELMGIINDPKTYDTVLKNITDATERQMNDMIKVIENMMNQMIPVLIKQFRMTMQGLLGNATKALNVELGGDPKGSSGSLNLGAAVIGTIFGSGKGRAASAADLVNIMASRSKRKKILKKTKKIPKEGSIEVAGYEIQE